MRGFSKVGSERELEWLVENLKWICGGSYSKDSKRANSIVTSAAIA